ncbi:Sarcosine oxidase subunit beta [Jannaschia seosinensis]|uniref:Sarcosine oxidase subunit beta n=1 Tax=Jannaschia seosinensis TaxID=313367 RepID=A0A0M7BDM4_9RHOB|nr:FAD-dependent oxidoreductase [Jannaschia seosinensis]CUH39892.1 Sarcosine oxidase subunit beta [Jannaschia seosinensis]
MAERVVIVGGAIMGSSLAWWLTELGHPAGAITVVERDPTYAACGTAFTNSCIRQQFGNPLNVRISQFGISFLKDFRRHMGDERVPEVHLHPFGYLYLADNEAMADRLRRAHAVQVAEGAGTRLMTPEEIAAEWPFFDTDGIVLGSHGTRDEGYFDGTTMFDWWRRIAAERGVTYLHDEVTGINTAGGRVRGVRLASGTRLEADIVVNAAGTRGAQIARMAGLDLPVEPRKRYTWVFSAKTPLPRDLPLTIDPNGFHVRTDGALYMAGATPAEDPAVDPDDFAGRWEIWEEVVWPAMATRIPAFEELRVEQSWVGHYDLNVFDANAIVGEHPDLPGFMILNGLSGHGLQQSPALGRGLAERIVHGRYESLDLTPFGPERLLTGVPFPELAVI